MIKDYKYMVLQRINKNEGEVRLSSISGPKPKYVTHKELKEVLKPIKDNMVTEKRLQEVIKPIKEDMVTREELREALKPMVTHEELKESLKPIREILEEILRTQQDHTADIRAIKKHVGM